MIAQLRAGKLFIQEKPGPKNSLGLVKFIFPNSHNVYMHDTPARQLFSQSRRDFSHGFAFGWNGPPIWPSGCCRIILGGT